jgi:hypothetical protein
MPHPIYPPTEWEAKFTHRWSKQSGRKNKSIVFGVGRGGLGTVLKVSFHRKPPSSTMCQRDSSELPNNLKMGMKYKTWCIRSSL